MQAGIVTEKILLGCKDRIWSTESSWWKERLKPSETGTRRG